MGFRDWEGENLLSNIMCISMIVMIVVMMFSMRLPYEISGIVMIGLFIYLGCFLAFTAIFTLWEAYIKSGTIVIEGYFNLAPGVAESAKIPIKEVIPIENLSKKERDDLKNYMVVYAKEKLKIKTSEDSEGKVTKKKEK